MKSTRKDAVVHDGPARMMNPMAAFIDIDLLKRRSPHNPPATAGGTIERIVKG